MFEFVHGRSSGGRKPPRSQLTAIARIRKFRVSALRYAAQRLRETPTGYALSLYQALTRINLPEADALEVVHSLERTMSTKLASKANITLFRAEMQHGFSTIRHEMSALQTSLVIKLGTLVVTLRGLMFVALRLSEPVRSAARVVPNRLNRQTLHCVIKINIAQRRRN